MERCEDGLLVFDMHTGSTTLLNEQASNVLNSFQTLEMVSKDALGTTLKPFVCDDSDISEILLSLENSRLILRC